MQQIYFLTAETDNMKLEQFVKQLRDNVDKFEQFYSEGIAAQDTEKFPDEMEEQDWLDQFLVYLGIDIQY